jgi:PKHD-type hydroxylase
MYEHSWVWKEKIPRSTCKEWIDRYDNLSDQALLEGGIEDTSYRSSDVFFVNDPDVLQTIYSLVKDANRMAFGFDIQDFVECQYTKYKAEQGGFYKSHIDCRISNNREMKYDRKISCVIMLSDQDDFSGGELSILGSNVELGIGDVIAFPSFLSHEVHPVTSGVRRVVVGWVEGPHFR